MKITNLSTYNLYHNSNDKKNEDFRLNDVGKDAANKESAKIVSKADLSNCTFEEMCVVARELFDAGQISVITHLFMTLDLSKGSTDDNQTPIDAYGRRNWLAEFSARAKVAFGSDMDQYARYNNIFLTLKRVQKDSGFNS